MLPNTISAVQQDKLLGSDLTFVYFVLYDHIIVSPGVKILLPNTISAVQQGKLLSSDLTFVYCVNTVSVGVKILLH